jgi:hypothetical protein
MEMNQKGFANIIFIILVVVLAGTVGYFSFKQIVQPPPTSTEITPPVGPTTPPIDSKKYTTEPIAECVPCMDGLTWRNKPCCTDSFEENCASKDGVVRTFDLHPSWTFLKGCFQKAPDTGKECASGKDCLSGVCELESAIKSNRCTLIKKEFTGGKNQYHGEEFYTASYSCSTPKPGVCTETISNGRNPGGVSHTFEMNNKTLIEVLESGIML